MTGAVLGSGLAVYLSNAIFRIADGRVPDVSVHLLALVLGVPLAAACVAGLLTPGRAGLKSGWDARPATLGVTDR